MKEADFGLQMVMLGSLPDEPVAVGPPIFPSDAHIYTFRPLPTSKYRDVLDFLNIMEHVFYILWLICCTVMTVVLSGLLHDRKVSIWRAVRRAKRRHSFLRLRWLTYARQMFRCTWHGASVHIDQELLPVVTPATRLLWFFYNFVVFVLVFGYAWNLITSDLVTIKESPRTDTVRQLLDIAGVYPEARFLFAKNSPLYNHLRNSHKGTLDHQLFLFFNEKETYDGDYRARWVTLDAEIELGPHTENIMSDLTDQLNRRTGGGIVMDEVIFDVFRHLACPMDARYITEIDASRGVIAPGIVSSIMNKRSNEVFKKYADYMMLTQLEMATISTFLKDVIALYLTDMPTSTTPLKLYQCLVGYRDKHEVVFNALNFELLNNTLYVMT